MDDLKASNLNWRVQILKEQKFNYKLKHFTHIKEFFNSSCGDKCEVFLYIKNDMIKEISYSLHGCGIQTAALEYVCSKVLNHGINEVRNAKEEILNFEVEKRRFHCLEFVEEICNWIMQSLNEYYT